MRKPHRLPLATLVAALAVAFSGRAAVAVGSCSPGDIDLDGVVGITGMLTLLAEWGPCAEPAACPADFDGDGIVGITGGSIDAGKLAEILTGAG